MGFFSRLASLISSNLNDAIDRAEDPQKMLDQVLREMAEQLIEAKKQVATAIADEKRLEKQAERERLTAADWEQKAMLAVRAGDDELARQALMRKKEHDQLTAAYADQHAKQKAAVDQLKVALKVLHGKIEEARRKKEVLIARQRRAEAMRSIQETMSSLKDTSAFEKFDRLSSRVDQVEAEAEAHAEINETATGDVLRHKLAELEVTQGADADLEALKQKMGLSPQKAEAAVRVEESVSAEDAEMAELEAALAELKAREG
jgi:phage shock protein A